MIRGIVATAPVFGYFAALLKEKGQIIKKKKAVASQLKGIESEIVKFQTLKQTSLNNVEVGLTLKMNQVKFLFCVDIKFHKTFSQNCMNDVFALDYISTHRLLVLLSDCRLSIWRMVDCLKISLEPLYLR